MSSQPSHALRRLLDACIDSFEKLELVMALRRAEGHRSTIRELADALDADRQDVRTMVADLCGCGIARASGEEVMLVPQTGEMASAMDELETTYDNDRIVLVKAIAESAMSRLRNLAGRMFAEAFVLRKKRGGDDDG